MGIVLNPNTDLDAALKEVEALPTPEPLEPVELSEAEMYDQGAEAQQAQDDRNAALEKYDASFLGSAWGSFRFNTGFGVAVESLFDERLAGPEDPDFNVNDSLDEVGQELPGIQSQEWEYLKKANNAKHLSMLVENLKDKREFQYNNEALGLPLALTAGLFAEIGNPINYVPIMRFTGLNKIASIKGALGVGAVQGLINVGEELGINAEYGDRNATDYLMAYTFGQGLGTASALLSKANTKAEMLSVQDSIDTLDRVVTKHVKEAAELADDVQKNGPVPVREYIGDDKEVMAHMKAKNGEEYYETVVKLDNDGNILEEIEPKPSTADQLHTAADLAEEAGHIDKEGKLPQSYLGLESMAHSLLRSDNKLTRYLASAILEHGEKSGFKQQTAALTADMYTDKIFGPYAKNKVILHGAWAKEAEKVGMKMDDFNKVMTQYIDNGTIPKNSTKEMNKIMAEFTEVYKDTNSQINKLARESGVEEFSGREDLDDLHLYRSYDTEAFYNITAKKGDKGESIKATLREAIRRGNWSEFSKKVDAGRDVDKEIEKIAEAVYNRMVKRATVNTADANLLSSGNQRLLKDALEDVDMSDADRKHILYVLDTQGRDLKANPMAKQIKMDLSTKVGDVAISDLLHTNLDANFLRKGKYWIGRSALAQKGEHLRSERAIEECIDAVNKHGLATGQNIDLLNADTKRLKAGIRMVLGQPIENLDEFGTTAMRNVRRLVAASGLGKLGIIQYGEGGRAIAAKGVSQAMLFPEIAKLTKSIVQGTMDSAALRDIEDHAVGQISTRIYLNHPMFRNDEFGVKTSKAESTLDKMSYFMTRASGWNRVHRMQTEYVIDGLSQKWYRDVMNGTFKETQMKDLGITGLDVRDIKKQMKLHATPAEGLSQYSKAKLLNVDKWEPGVRQKFALMLHRKSKNAIQDIFAGETPLWMNTTIGKLLGQFRSFSVAALSKQTTRDFKMLKQGDLEGALMLEFMMTTSAIATLAKTGYKSLGMQGDERKEFLDKELSPAQFLTNVLSYTGSTSGLADFGTTVSSNLFGVNLAGQRMYHADGISGLTPGLQYIDKAVRGATGIVTSPVSGLSRADARAAMSVLPLNTLWGVDLITKLGVDSIPE